MSFISIVCFQQECDDIMSSVSLYWLSYDVNTYVYHIYLDIVYEYTYKSKKCVFENTHVHMYHPKICMPVGCIYSNVVSLHLYLIRIIVIIYVYYLHWEEIKID